MIDFEIIVRLSIYPSVSMYNFKVLKNHIVKGKIAVQAVEGCITVHKVFGTEGMRNAECD